MEWVIVDVVSFGFVMYFYIVKCIGGVFDDEFFF